MLLKITLKSDLCAAVGKHFAAMVDLDTALDEYGVPFIPSRRLKGCLKEIAEMCSTEDDIKRIFGKSGANENGSLHISNARIENYDSVINEIKSKKFSAEKVTELFCSVRGETAIENNTAKEKSLRYIRVVNRISPINQKPLEFFAEIDFDEKDKELIENKYFKALRNIGYHRNRGLGAVECEFIPDNKANKDNFVPDKSSFENCSALRLTVRLDGDLMLPDNDANHSDDYISGTMLLGAVAAKYNRKNKNSDNFNSLFFSDVCFGNLYPAVVSYNGDKPEYSYTIPAPRYFAKIKAANENEKGIYNIIGKDDKKQYKPLKKGYISKEYGHIKPETKIVYHNGNISTDEKGLYMQYCLSSGQYFSGTITGNPEKIKQIAELFYNGETFDDTLHFGRSKTAQYSLCNICEFRADDEVESEKSSDSKGCIAAYIFESDVLLADENGCFTTDIEKLCQKLNIDDIKSLRKETSISAKTVSGYNSKWNMKKPQFPVIAAGSVVVFDMSENDEVKRKELQLIGEKQNEGYGKVRLVYNADKETIDSQKLDTVKPNESNSLSDLIEKNSRLDKLTALAIDNAWKIDLNPSQIGRIILMAKDADKVSEDKFIDFEKRIYSIKTESTCQSAISSFGEKALEKLLTKYGIQFADCDVKCGKDSEKAIIKTVSDKDWEYVYKYILTTLTVRKYQLRKENSNND